MLKTGVIILAHGSRNEGEVSEILSVVSGTVKAWLPPEIEVVGAAMQFNHPDLEEATELLVKQGVKRVVIMPYFLFQGIHPTRDIPSRIEVIKQTNPGVELVLANTLGIDEYLTNLVVKRIQEAAPELLLNHGFAATQNAPQPIESHSMAIVEDLLPSLDGSEEERQVIKRIVHASGDPQVASLVRFHPNAVSSGIAAIRQGKPIFTDVRMVAAGINHYLAHKFGCSIHCAFDEPDVMRQSPKKSTTSSAAAVRSLGMRLSGVIVAIGNAPTALLTLLDLIDSRGVHPSLVVGTPVGFVQAKESKAELMKQDIPYITIEGTRGGSAAAVATVNALLNLAQQVDK
jgi:precorrin-8X/cobalt-precorrin-8 methylmutase